MQLVTAPDTEKNVPSAFLQPLGETPEELDVRRRGHRQGCDEPERPRARRRDIAQVHRGGIPSDLRWRRAGGNVGLLVHDVRRDNEVVVPPVDDAAIMAEADRLPAIVDPRKDVDRAALPDVRELGHKPAACGVGLRRLWARDVSRPVHGGGGGSFRGFLLRRVYIAATARTAMVMI